MNAEGNFNLLGLSGSVGRSCETRTLSRLSLVSKKKGSISLHLVVFVCVNRFFFFSFTLVSLRRSALPTRSCQTLKRRSFMTDMENRVYGREEEEDQAWMISSPIFLVEGCLVSWGDRAEDEMVGRGEAKTWCTL